MLAQALATLLGVWVMAAPAALGYGGAMAVSDRVVGPVAACVAAVAMAEAMRGVRWANLPLAGWLVVAPWLLGAPPVVAAHGLAVGLLLGAFASVGGHVRGRYGGGWRSLVRPDAADGQLAALRAALGDTARDVIARVDQAESTLNGELERVGNTLAAYIGELEDRLSRGTPPRA